MLIPLFTYCSIITSNYTKSIESRNNNFEKRANQIVYGGMKNFPKLSIISCQNKRLCVQVLKCLNGNVCEFLNNNTRNRGKLLRLSQVKLESTKKGFYFNGAKHFNSLLVNLRSTSSLSEFDTLSFKTNNIQWALSLE